MNMKKAFDEARFEIVYLTGDVIVTSVVAGASGGNVTGDGTGEDIENDNP
jgi:hypothetical protein